MRPVDNGSLLQTAWLEVMAVASARNTNLPQLESTDESHFRSAFVRAAKECMKCRENELALAAIRAMVDSLNDRHSLFLEPEAWHSYSTNTVIGLGFSTVSDGMHLLARDVPLGSPADRAGLKPGDLLLRINGVPVFERRNPRVRFRENKPALLTIDRPDVGLIELKAVPRRLSLDGFDATLLANNVAYVSLPSFPSGDTKTSNGSIFGKEFEKDLARLSRARPDGWILDLRGNTGGDSYSAGMVAGYFGLRDTLAKVESKNQVFVIPVFAVPMIFDKPVVILMDSRTSSAAEVVAEALRQAGIARLVGTRTGGFAGTDVAVFPVGKGGLLLSSGQVAIGPKQVQIGPEGIEPDETISLDRRALADGHDLQLEAAMSYLLGTR